VTRRAQANVVGVALLLGITVVALGALTVSLGAVVEDNAERASTTRVADGFERSLRPVETTGPHRGRVAFADGSLRTADRDLRVLDGNDTVARVRVGALRYETGDRAVVFLSGAVVRRAGESAWLADEPPISGHADDDVLVVGAARVGDSEVAVGGTGRTRRTIETNVSHERRALGNGSYRVAVETRTPGPWTRYFERQGATTTTRDIDGDGVPSVVATYPGPRTAYLVVHDLRVEVTDG